MSRNMHKLRVKVCNATIYPPLGQVKKKKILQKCTPPSSEMQDLLQRWHLKGIDKKNQGYFWSGALQVTILRKVIKCLAFSRKWVGNPFYMANWTLIYGSYEICQWVQRVKTFPQKSCLKQIPHSRDTESRLLTKRCPDWSGSCLI